MAGPASELLPSSFTCFALPVRCRGDYGGILRTGSPGQHLAVHVLGSILSSVIPGWTCTVPSALAHPHLPTAAPAGTGRHLLACCVPAPAA